MSRVSQLQLTAFWAVGVVLLLSSLLVNASSPSSLLGDYRLLLIVGDVGSNSARILYEALPSSETDHEGCRDKNPSTDSEVHLTVKVFEEPHHQEVQTIR